MKYDWFTVQLIEFISTCIYMSVCVIIRAYIYTHGCMECLMICLQLVCSCSTIVFTCMYCYERYIHAIIFLYFKSGV